MIQLMTRHRRPGEEIEFPECWDEIVDGKNTGRIVKSFKTHHSHVEYEYLNIENPIEEPIEEIDTPVQEQIDVPTIILYKLTVNHHYGNDEIYLFDKIDLNQYQKEIDDKFWIGFVKSISVSEMKVLSDG